MAPSDLRSAAAIAQELSDTLTHAAVLAEQLAQMGFDVPGGARTGRATVRDVPREGSRDAGRASSRGTDVSHDTGSAGESRASGHDSSSSPGEDGARWPRDEVRDVAQSLAHQDHPADGGVCPGHDRFPGSEAVREPRDVARGSSFEERKKDLLSFSTSKRAKEPRDDDLPSRTTETSRDEVMAALEPLREQCRKCSLPATIDNNGVSVLQGLTIDRLEYAVGQLCRQIRTDPTSKVRSPMGLLVSKAYEGDEMFFARPEPAPVSPPPAPTVDSSGEDEITLDDLWSQLDDDQRTSIDHTVKNSRFKGPMMILSQKRTLAAELLGINLDDSSAA